MVNKKKQEDKHKFLSGGKQGAKQVPPPKPSEAGVPGSPNAEGKGPEEQSAVDDAASVRPTESKKRNFSDILKEADPHGSKDTIEKFFALVVKIKGYLQIEDDPETDMVAVLRKIENGLNDRAEARNFFYDRYLRNPKNVPAGRKDIKTFEAEHEKELKDKIFEDRQLEARRK